MDDSSDSKLDAGHDEALTALESFFNVMDASVEREIEGEKKSAARGSNAPERDGRREEVDEKRDKTEVPERTEWTAGALSDRIRTSVLSLLEDCKVKYTASNLVAVSEVMADLSLSFAKASGMEEVKAELERAAREVTEKAAREATEKAAREATEKADDHVLRMMYAANIMPQA